MILRDEISNLILPPVFAQDPAKRLYADRRADAVIALVQAHMTSDEAVTRGWWAHMKTDGTALDMFRAAILAALEGDQ